MGLIFAAAEFSLEGEDFVEADEGGAMQDLGPVDEPDPIFSHLAVEDLYRSRQVDGDVVMSRLGVPGRVDLDLGAASSHDVYVPYIRERSVSEHRCTAEQGIVARKEPWPHHPTYGEIRSRSDSRSPIASIIAPVWGCGSRLGDGVCEGG